MKKQAINKTNEILNSLDGVKKIKAPDFFYTRLRAKMLARQTDGEASILSRPDARLLRPAYAIAILALILTFNVISLLKQNNSETNTAINPENETAQTIASAYNLDDNFSYELNQ